MCHALCHAPAPGITAIPRAEVAGALAHALLWLVWTVDRPSSTAATGTYL